MKECSIVTVSTFTDKTPLRDKTINKCVIVMLNAMNSCIHSRQHQPLMRK